MKLSLLTVAIACTLPVSSAFAAALDRSGQSISAFLQPNNYFEANLSGLMPTVEGKEAGTFAASGKSIDNMSDDYLFGNLAIKLQPTEQFSFGIIADQPFGAAASYTGNNAFISNPKDPVLGSIKTLSTSDLSNFARTTAPTGETKVKVNSYNLSMLFGFQPNSNWNVYGGPVYQAVKGDVSLRGSAYSVYNGYDANIPQTEAWGWLAGAAFQIPEIALKASLTYRSKINHDSSINENVPMVNSLAKAQSALPTLFASLAKDPAVAASLPAINKAIVGAIAANAASPQDSKITTPQSVNLDLQSGIMADTLAFANIRWVNWKDFSIQPYKFGLISKAVGPLVGQPNGFDLVAYDKDQWSVTTGIGRKFSDKWSGVASVGWDSGAGNPVTTLGPTEGYWNVGLGAQYSPAPNYFVSGGVKYFWLGDAKAQTGAQFGTDGYVADFADNNAIAVGMKLGYRF